MTIRKGCLHAPPLITSPIEFTRGRNRHEGRERALITTPALCRQATRDRDAAKAIARAKRPVICDGPSLGRKRCESFAASRAYDVSTRQVVAIHTQYREKVAPPLNDLLKSNFVVDIHQPGSSARPRGRPDHGYSSLCKPRWDRPCCDSSDLASLFLPALKGPSGSAF